jgi:single-strand DNA-binding protein
VANLNKVLLIGRLTRDPEVRTFSNGGKVAKFGFAVNNRKKNAQSGQWEDDPVFLDVEAFNRGENGRQADLIADSLRKGHQVFIEGHLRLDQWTSQDGQKRSKIAVVVDNFQFLERREDGGEGGPRPMRSAAPAAPRKPAPSYPGGSNFDDSESNPPDVGGGEGQEEDIPF